MIGSAPAAMVWGQRHYGRKAPWSKPDMMVAAPGNPSVCVIIKKGVPYDDAREILRFHEAKWKPIWFIKARDKYTRDCMDSLGFEYIEWETNKEYWGDLAAAWRDVEIRMVCTVVTFSLPEKPKKPKRRKAKARV